MKVLSVPAKRASAGVGAAPGNRAGPCGGLSGGGRPPAGRRAPRQSRVSSGDPWVPGPPSGGEAGGDIPDQVVLRGKRSGEVVVLAICRRESSGVLTHGAGRERFRGAAREAGSAVGVVHLHRACSGGVVTLIWSLTISWCVPARARRRVWKGRWTSPSGTSWTPVCDNCEDHGVSRRAGSLTRATTGPVALVKNCRLPALHGAQRSRPGGRVPIGALRHKAPSQF
jgi:hypothetical protein